LNLTALANSRAANNTKRAARAAVTPSVFNTPGSLNLAALANSRAANKAAAEAAEAARFNKAAFVGQPAPIVAESIPTAANIAYNQAKRLANMRKSCTPCEGAILEKLDTLLDRSKPSTILGAIKGTGAFVVTQVGAALSDAEAALRMAIETGNKKSKKFAENALKYSQKKLEQLLKALTLSDETKKKIGIALSKIKDALVMLAKITGIVIGGSAAAAIVAALVPVAAAAAIIAGLALAGSSSLNYLITVAVPAATAAWSAAKAKILVGLGLAKNFMISTRKSLGKALFNFGTRVSGAAKAAFSAIGSGAGAVSRAMYRLSGREQADMIKLLVQKVTSLELQGKITGKALEELNAAIASAKPGVVTADVAAEAKAAGASPAVVAAAVPNLTNAAAVPRLTNGSSGSLAEVERRNPPLAESPTQVLSEEAPRPLQTRGVAAPPGAPLIEGMNGGKNRSRKNRKSSRKNRKNRKGSRKH
jgi:hypothetical protein